MSKKKVLFSVTAGAAIATTFMGVDSAEAASHKVKSGDSLWKIANSYNTTVADLMKINKLNGDIIFPNQMLQTSTSDKPTANTKPSTSSNADTYTVKSGDTLSGIASKHGVSYKDIMNWSSLSTTLIFPGNVLTVSKSSSSGNSTPPKAEDKPANPPTNATTYVVKSGDTLSHIARAYGVSVNNLKKWNNISSHIIHIGQKVMLKNNGGSNNSGSDNSKPVTGNPPSSSHDGFDVNKLLSAANNVMGTPYVWGGQTTSGFDCSGFIHFAYDEAGMSASRTSTDGYFNRSFYIDKPEVGDLVFFKGTYRAGISHMGIYIGNNEFIHAGSSTGVTVTNLNNSYWQKHFDSFKRFY